METRGHTNANHTKIAAILADADQNTTTELIIRKKGTLRGRGDNRKRYGDDLVHVTLLTGFSYGDVLQRSRSQLDMIIPEQIVVLAADAGLVTKEGKPVCTKDATIAIQELRESLKKSLQGENQATTGGNFDTLVVDGNKVQGARVYKGPQEGQKTTTDTEPGTVYLQGILCQETILQEAENGAVPKPQSKGPALAKRVLRKQLDLGHYVSYILSPTEPFLLQLGGTAPMFSDGQAVHFKKEEIERVFGKVPSSDF